jgi:hypothetical protein
MRMRMVVVVAIGINHIKTKVEITGRKYFTIIPDLLINLYL